MSNTAFTLRRSQRIEPPQGATHYTGPIEDPCWWKAKYAESGVYWCYYSEQRKEWYIQSIHQPHDVTPVPAPGSVVDV
jgi:hypothetical protein